MKKLLLLAVIALASVAFVKQTYAASQLVDAKVTLGTSRGGVSTSHAFSFVTSTGSTITKFTFDYCKVASGEGAVNCPSSVSQNISVATPNISAVSANLGVPGDFTFTGGNSLLTAEVTDVDGIFIDASQLVTMTINQVTNTSLGENCDTTPTGTDTCFIWIKTYDESDNVVDETVITYTIVDAVQVTAKVDPTFTFLVSGVLANTVNNEITTSVASAANTLPFGSLQAGVPRYAAHRLNVTTNTQGGYTVSARMSTQMTGVYEQNNIDPFMAAWGTPTTWTLPTGATPNDNTGWVGANTTDLDITGWQVGNNPAQKFGGIGSTGVTVSQKASSDAGDPVFVTYVLGVNVYQPSDSYEGTLVYNALPTY